jgi:DNA-binding SARP family transcriptional activator/tetratricopeptide (TPR) repeat protein
VTAVRSGASAATARADAPIDVRLLGPIEIVTADGTAVSAGTRKQRGLLAILALARGQVVSADRLVDELWGDDPPPQALGSLYPYVSNLRRLLEPRRDAPPSLLVTVPPGYVLRLAPGTVDAQRFEVAAAEVSASVGAGDWSRARTVAGTALTWWRGPALGEFAFESWAVLDAVRLDELRLTMLEDLFEARLPQHDGQLVADVERFVGEHPLRERAWALCMRALYAAGRQSDALQAFHRVRAHLAGELGVEPGRELVELEQAILRHEEALPVARLDATIRLDTVAREPEPAVPAPGDTTAAETGAPVTTELLVGRASELAVARGVLDDVGGGPRALILEGEPGIGKTRLAEELAADATARGVLVVWGRSFEGAAAPAFWPWLPALRTLAELVPDGPVDDVGALLSTSPAASAASGPNRYLLFDAVCRLLETAAARRPLMIVLDDLQWADVASLELLTTIATRLQRPGVLLVATVRDTEVRDDGVVTALAALTRMTGSRRLRLRGLDLDDTAALVVAIAGVAVEPATAAVMHDRADGNPFFITELARLLATTAGPVGGDDIPAGVRDVIRRRLHPLPAATVELLHVAAVAGREVELAVLAAATDVEMLDCLESLEPAVLLRLVVHLDERPGTYRFVHALVRDVLVDELSPLDLAVEHLRLADAIDDGDDDTVELVAEHLWAAQSLGVALRAAETLERAAHVALGRAGYEAAQRHLERAAELYGSVADDDAGAEGELRCLNLMTAIAVAHGGYVTANTSPIVARARQLGARIGDDVNHMTTETFEYLGRLVAGDLRTADRVAPRLLAVAEATSHPLIRSLGHNAYAGLCMYHGRLAEAAAHLETARDAADDAARLLDDSPVSPMQLYMAHPILMHVRDLMGELPHPDATSAEMRRLVPRDPVWSLSIATFASLGAMMVGDPQRGVRAAQAGLADDPHAAFGAWSSMARMCLRASTWMGGTTTQGVPALLAELDDFDARPATASIVLSATAIGLARAGHPRDASGIAESARRVIGDNDDFFTEPFVLLAEGVVADALGDVPRAGEQLAAALRIAERQDARAVAAHVRATAHDLGLFLPTHPRDDSSTG